MSDHDNEESNVEEAMVDKKRSISGVNGNEKANGKSRSRDKKKSRSSSRSRSRTRSPSRERSSHKKKRHRPRRSRSVSRSKSRSRTRSKLRSRSRSKRRFRRSRSRSRSKSYDDYGWKGGHGGRRPPPRPNGYIPPDAPPSRCLGVFGLSLYTDERMLDENFSKFGRIEKIQIVYDKMSGRSRGFCFIYFDNVEDATEAKERCTGMEIDGQRIRVDYSLTKRPHTPTPGIYMGRREYYKNSPPPHHQRRRSRSFSPRR